MKKYHDVSIHCPDWRRPQDMTLHLDGFQVLGLKSLDLEVDVRGGGHTLQLSLYVASVNAEAMALVDENPSP